MKLSIPSGTTSKRIAIFIQDSSSTTGAGLTGLTNASAGLTCYSWIDTDGDVAATAQTLSSATRGTFTSGGFIQKDSTNQPGAYEFGIPNALLASGVKWAFIMFKGATNMAPLPIEIEVTATSNQDAVRGGMTALPNANAEAAGGLYTRGTGAGQIAQDANGNVRVNVDTIKTNAVVNGGTITFPTTATLASTTNITAATGIDVTKWLGTAASTPTVAGVPNVNAKTWNDLTTVALPLVPTIAGRTLDVSAGGESGVDWANVGSPTTANALTGTTIATTQKVDIETIKTNAVVNAGTITFPTTATLASTTNLTAGTITTVSGNVDGSVGSVTGAVGSVTGAVGSVTGAVGSVTGAVGSVTGAVGSVTAAVTVGTNNDKTGYALTAGERTSIADAALDRDMSTGTDSGSTTVRTMRQALRFLRNKWSISGGTLTVTKEDDATASWTGAVTQTAGNPVSAIDPAGP